MNFIKLPGTERKKKKKTALISGQLTTRERTHEIRETKCG